MSRIHDAMMRAQQEQERTNPGRLAVSNRRGRPLDTVPTAYERVVQRILGAPQDPNVILVVSAVAAEGASTVARNLATALDRGEGNRVVLVDANLRTPSQHHAFGVPPINGLSDVVTGSIPLTSAVRNGFGLGLSVLACGRSPKGPGEVLALRGFRSNIMELRSQFEWVIIDGPPVTTYPDASTLARVSDGVVLVLQAESTRWEVAEEARKVLEASRAPILGVVLNRRKYHIPPFIYRRL